MVEISAEAMASFAANILEVRNRKGDPYIILSENALAALRPNQRKILESCATLLPVAIPTIEHVGGGSARCMIAEVFIPRKERAGYRIKNPETTQDFEAYYHLRWEMLRKPWKQPKGSEKDEGDSSAVHLMAENHLGEAIGVARVHQQEPGVSQIRYMAVASEYQGRGVGRALVIQAEQIARETGSNVMILQARENALEFYLSLGYEIMEKTYVLFDEIQHFRMEKILN